MLLLPPQRYRVKLVNRIINAVKEGILRSWDSVVVIKIRLFVEGLEACVKG